MAGQLREFHDRGAGVGIPALRDSVNGRNHGFGAGIDDDLPAPYFRRAVFELYGHDVRRQEMAFAGVDRDPVVVGQFVVVQLAQRIRQFIFRLDGFFVIGGLPAEIGESDSGCQMCLVDQVFGRNASDVDAGSAVHFVRTFDHRDAPAVAGQLDGQGFPSLAEADDNGIILFHMLMNFGCRLNFCVFSSHRPAVRPTIACKIIASPEAGFIFTKIGYLRDIWS